MADEVAYGIDLGTSTSEIAYVRSAPRSRPEVIGVGGRKAVPSVVWFDDLSAAGRIVVGREALENQIRYSTGVISSVKRQMGKSAAELRDPKRGDPRLPVRFGEREYGPVEISAEILRFLVEGATDEAGRLGLAPVRDVVVTVPAEFEIRQKEATVEAVRQAGLGLQMLLPEPVAAILAYGDLDPEREQTVLVYDLGGGTLDCTIIHVARGENRVLAKTGGMNCAGDRIDQLLYEEICRRLKDERAVDLHGLQANEWVVKTRQRVLNECRKLKELLSETDGPVLFNGSDLQIDSNQSIHLITEITRREFEGLIDRVVQGNSAFVRRALGDAALTPGEINRVLLVGGSTRIPLVRRRIEEFFGPDRVMSNLSPDLIVAQGAAMAAMALQQGRSVVSDTLMRSLGIQDSGSDRFISLIPRGTSLAHAERKLTSHWPAGQASVPISLWEAEEGAATIHDQTPEGEWKCRYVGTWELEPEQPVTEPTVAELRLTCDPRTSLPELEARIHGVLLRTRRHNSPPAGATALLKVEEPPELDVIFVVDTTGSIRHTSAWEQLKPALRQAHKLLTAGKRDLRCGVTTFGDLRESTLGPGDPIQVMDLTPQERVFLGYVSRLDHCATEGGDDPESCLDALWKSLGNGLRAGARSLRAFILITDAGRPADPVNVTQAMIVQELRQKGVSVFAVSPYAPEYMELCEQTGGRWWELDDTSLGEKIVAVTRELADRAARLGA